MHELASSQQCLFDLQKEDKANRHLIALQDLQMRSFWTTTIEEALIEWTEFKLRKHDSEWGTYMTWPR